MKKLYLILILGLCLLPGHLLAACVLTPIAFNDSEAGSWDSGCTSTHRAGAYAQYYTFTLAGSQEVTIDLTSSVDTYLYLLSGTGENGSVIEADDDDGAGLNSRITIILQAGSYTIEATTLSAATAGTFTLTLSATASGACNNFIDSDTSVPGVWAPGCNSTHAAGSYAKYYTFTLLTNQTVTINLTSTADNYMYLLAGAGQTGTVLAQDNNSGTGTNSRITIALTAGAYTIEATTNAAATTGSFVVSLSTSGSPTPGPCENLINVNIRVQGSWDAACASENRTGRYAKYYTFTLSSTRDVTIDLESVPDNYLFLLKGAGKDGDVLAENDDGGVGPNARISITLAAGTYTVEATTYANATTGTFFITVNAETPSCADCPFQINAGLNDAWFNPATSGQGLNITVYPGIKRVFVTWFTFDVERPPPEVTSMLGGPGQRWLTAQGPYDDDTATLTIYVTEGGVFDSVNPKPVTDQDGDGTLILEFAGCNEALATYDITSLDISGEIPLERIVLDNVELCEMLAEP